MGGRSIRNPKEAIDDLELLYALFSFEPEVLKRVAPMRLIGPNPASAIGVYDKLFERAPAMLQDKSVVGGLIEGSRRAESRDVFFEIALGHAGTVGPDIVYDIVYKSAQQKSPAYQRAVQTIQTKEFRAAASPALLIAVDFRYSMNCVDKKRLLDRVQKHGDERTLILLQALRSTKGCGWRKGSDCWKCMRDGQLDRAIKVVAKRVSANEKAQADSK
jgi:hypothetical protein